MASKTLAKSHLFLSLNLLCYFLFTTATATACDTCGSGGSSIAVSGNGGSTTATCPRDALKLGICANLLGSLLGVVVGNPPTTPCCSLLAGLVDLEAAVCLCTAIRANVLGINLNVPLSLSLLLNVCGNTPPTGFTC